MRSALPAHKVVIIHAQSPCHSSPHLRVGDESGVFISDLINQSSLEGLTDLIMKDLTPRFLWQGFDTRRTQHGTTRAQTQPRQ